MELKKHKKNLKTNAITMDKKKIQFLGLGRPKDSEPP